MSAVATSPGELSDSIGPNVQVYCRIRPLLTPPELRTGSVVTVLPGAGALQCWEDAQTTRPKGSPFAFDGVFGPDASQEHVYTVAEPVVRSVLAGYNGTIFAFGQTASGKTFTIQGPDLYDPQQQGIVARTVSSLFASVRDAEASWEFTIKVSCVEIYMERIRDLLAPTKNNLPIRQDEVKGIFVDGVQEEYVASPAELMGIIEEATANRAVSATGMNAGSSRSHSVVTITVEARSRTAPAAGLRIGKLNIVDLAGSESLRRSAATGQTAAEAMVINTSLSALGNVIYALSSQAGARSAAQRDASDSASVVSKSTRKTGTFASPAASTAANNTDSWDTSSVVSSSAASTTSRRTSSGLGGQRTRHIPYRDSKLTRLLQESLGGNSKTVLIVCVSPTLVNLSETLSTLRFGVRAKRIKNRVHVNTRRTPEEMQVLLQKAESAIDAQQGLIMALKEQIKVLKEDGGDYTRSRLSRRAGSRGGSLRSHSAGSSGSCSTSGSSDSESGSSSGGSMLSAGAEHGGRASSAGSSQASCITDFSAPGLRAAAGLADAAGLIRPKPQRPKHAAAGSAAHASNAMEVVLLREQLAKHVATVADLRAQLQEKDEEVSSLSATLADSEATVQQLRAAASAASAAAAAAAAADTSCASVTDAGLAGHDLTETQAGLGPVPSAGSVASGDPSSSAMRVAAATAAGPASALGDALPSIAGTSLVLDGVDALPGSAEAGIAALTFELTSLREEAHAAREQARVRAREVVELQGLLDAASESSDRQVAQLRRQLVASRRALESRGPASSSGNQTFAARVVAASPAPATGWVEESDESASEQEPQSSSSAESVTGQDVSQLAAHQLQQLLVVHRQLQRKYAVMEQEYKDMLSALRGRDNRLKRALAANSGQHMALRQLRTSHAEQEAQIRWLRMQLQELGELHADGEAAAEKPPTELPVSSRALSNIVRPVRGGIDAP